jgi:hypothetical protein
MRLLSNDHNPENRKSMAGSGRLLRFDEAVTLAGGNDQPLLLAAVDRAAGQIYAHFDFGFSRFRVIGQPNGAAPAGSCAKADASERGRPRRIPISAAGNTRKKRLN